MESAPELPRACPPLTPSSNQCGLFHREVQHVLRTPSSTGPRLALLAPSPSLPPSPISQRAISTYPSPGQSNRTRYVWTLDACRQGTQGSICWRLRPLACSCTSRTPPVHPHRPFPYHCTLDNCWRLAPRPLCPSARCPLDWPQRLALATGSESNESSPKPPR